MGGLYRGPQAKSPPGQPQSDEGHSGQVSPIESSTSAIATPAACDEMPSGGSVRAIWNARLRACGSARSCIHPCSSHSRMAPASLSTEIAQLRSVRIAGFLSFVISIEMAPAGPILSPRGPFRAANTGQGFQIAWLLLFHVFRPPVQNVRRPTPDLI